MAPRGGGGAGAVPFPPFPNRPWNNRHSNSHWHPGGPRHFQNNKHPDFRHQLLRPSFQPKEEYFSQDNHHLSAPVRPDEHQVQVQSNDGCVANEDERGGEVEEEEDDGLDESERVNNYKYSNSLSALMSSIASDPHVLENERKRRSDSWNVPLSNGEDFSFPFHGCVLCNFKFLILKDGNCREKKLVQCNSV